MNRVPYHIIVKAHECDSLAIKQIIHHFGGYINTFSKVSTKDNEGNTKQKVDSYMKHRIETKLITEILKYKI